VRMLVERSLRRGGRGATPADITLTISENVRGLVLIAELRRGEERLVDMAEFRSSIVPIRPRPALLKKLVWEQEAPMLDVALPEGNLLVLERARVVEYARPSGSWEMIASQDLPQANSRDPRGRMEISGDDMTIHLPGKSCRGTWRSALDLRCDAGDSAFAISDLTVRFTEGRNTLEATGWPTFFSYAKAGWLLVAETDGRTHLYDAQRQPAGIIDSWGSDFTAIDGACTGKTSVLATSAAGSETSDSVALYQIEDRKPSAVSEAAELPGPVTALWPSASGAVAIVRQLVTGRYAAYSLTLDCGR
jgi:hypothetical protein